MSPLRPHRPRGQVAALGAVAVTLCLVAVSLFAATASSAAPAHAGQARQGHPGHLAQAMGSRSTGGSQPAPFELHQAVAPAATLHPPALRSTLAPARIVLSTNYDATDPSLVHWEGSYLLYTTGGGFAQDPHVVVHVGTAIGKWNETIEAMPTLPAWVSGNVWAPAIQQVKGGWALYFTALVAGVVPDMQCIGAAFATQPLGPFVAEGLPIICQVNHRGSIDPRTFVDAQGNLWLDWKSDDNADPNTPGPDQGGLTGIWVQRLSLDGHQLLGQPTEIFQPDQAWQGTIVESPQMIEVGGTFYLFFSGNWFNQPDYAIGVAQCASVLGPCHSLGSQPFLASNLQGTGPGEPSVYVGSLGVYVLYTPTHADAPNLTPPRPVAMARLGFGPFGPYLAQW